MGEGSTECFGAPRVSQADLHHRNSSIRIDAFHNLSAGLRIFEIN